MQNKGFVSVIAVLLALLCAYYISFSYGVRRVEKKAEAYAAETGNSAKYFLDSISNETVWLGKTFKQAQEMQVGLGLDLKGGMNVILEISVADVLKSLAAENAQNPTFVQALAETQNAGEVESGDNFVDAFAANYKKIDPTGKLADVFSTYQLKEKITKSTSDAEVVSIIKSEMESALSNSFNVLRNRIDRFGVVAPNIQRLQQAGRILVELPGVKEPERVKKLLQGSANLEFWETYQAGEIAGAFQNMLMAEAQKNVPVASDSAAVDSVALANAMQNSLAARVQVFGDQGPVIAVAQSSDTAALNALFNQKQYKDAFPCKLKLAWSVKSFDDKGLWYQLYALKAHDNLGHPSLPDATKGGDIVVDASADFEQIHNEYQVSMTMTPEAGNTWAKLTKENVGKCVAIVLDDVVYSAPRVNQEITGGRSQITGNFDTEEANDLANVLKSGKMAAKVNIVSEDVVGPTLGSESIKASVISFIVALVLLFIYMVLFYGVTAGLVADCCLLINAFFTLGILSSFHAVLTLSGIAGIVLSMGIAVDANVLIYERAKEELASGKQLRSAVDAAYRNAFSAIFDANLTSLITGIILYYFGTGPIRGFAVTFIIGIITSFVSAVFLSRIFFEWALGKGWFKNLTFTGALSGLLKPTHIDFVKKGYFTTKVYAVIAVLAIVLMFFPGLEKGIDFTSGRNYVVAFNEVAGVDNEALAEKLQNNATLNDAAIKVITISRDNQVRITTNYDLNAADDAQANLIMKQAIYDAGKELGYVSTDFEAFNNEDNIPSTQKVGPSIAEDITYGAIVAIILSLIAIALYILLRFRNVAFSIGAILGLAANTLVILGLYCLLPSIMPFSMEVDQAFIAAILTVIGYSINDIVVVFDRIREVSTLYPNKTRYNIVNEALNATMPRTLNTSISTLLVLVVIFVLGGATIRSFIFAMLLGVVVDPLTTIFLAVPAAYYWMGKKEAKAEAVAKK